MPKLFIENIIKTYGSVRAVNDISLTVENAELIALLGPSGCGKTTLLRMIAGFVEATSGQIRVDDKDITYLPAYKRNTGMVFQGYALFPHMTVAQNVAFGLEMRKTPKEEIKKRVTDALALVHMEAYADRYPRQMSGGQQQRVAVARALVIHPDVFLLDEPLSNLDAKLRQSVGAEIRSLQQEMGLTTVFVTHDQNEALALADRLVVMNQGRIIQTGSGHELYNRPKSRFVANFLGQSNFFNGVVSGNKTFKSTSGLELKYDKAPDHIENGNLISLRPENIALGNAAQHCANQFEATVTHITYLGSTTQYQMTLNSGDTLLVHHQNKQSHEVTLTPGATTNIGWDSLASLLLEDDSPTLPEENNND